MKQKNVLRKLLDEGKPTFGMRVLSIWPGLVEVIGHSGVIDYVEFQGDYAPYDLHTLENFGRAVDLFDDMSAMMKIEQQPRTFLAIRAIGSGIQNLIFADIRTPEDAAEVVASSRAETPETGGIAGVGMRRDVGYVVHPGSPEYVESLEQGIVALTIEKRSAIEKLEEVLSVKGVDMVQFGKADYSMSIGSPGEWESAKVKDAESQMIQTALRMGITPRVEIQKFEQAQYYMDMGVKDFCLGTDVEVIFDYCRDQVEKLANLLGR